MKLVLDSNAFQLNISQAQLVIAAPYDHVAIVLCVGEACYGAALLAKNGGF